MAVNIGPKIGIDGEAEYRKQINNIIQQAKTLDSQMRAVTSSFTEETKEKEKSAAKGKILSQQVDVQRQRVKALTEMLQRSAKEFGENDTRTLKWKEAVNDATTQLNKLERELKDNTGDVDKMGDALEKSEKHAFSFGDALKANVIGEAITSGIRALADSLVNMASAAKEAFVDTVQWADDLATLSTQTGLTTESLQEFEYMADLMDTDVDTITGSMAKLIKNMTTASKGTGDAAAAFEALGINITNADGSLRDNQEVFYETVDALGAMTNETQRDAYAMSIFGKSAQDLNPLIAAGAEGMAAFAQEARDTGYVLNDEALTSLVNVSDAMARLENEAEGLKRRLAAELAPTIEDFVSEQLPAIMEDVEDIAVNLLLY